MKKLHSRHRVALAVWMLCASPLAPAGVTLTGSYWLNPGPMVALGPGDVDLSGQALWVGGRAGDGSFTALAGAQVQLRSLFMAAGQSTATGVLDGAGTQLSLVADGHGSMLELGNYGNATLTVSNGATLDARSKTSACAAAGTYCGSVVSNSAGSTARLTLTGAGTSASFYGLTVGNGGVDTRYDFGTPGGVSEGLVWVQAGAALRSGQGTVGVVYPGVGGNGLERGWGAVTINGAGSNWTVDGGPQNGETTLSVGVNSQTKGQVSVTSNGRLALQQAAPGHNVVLNLGSDGGEGVLSVVGSGAMVVLQGEVGHSFVNIGSRGGTGTLGMLGGKADFSSAQVTVGNDGNGDLFLDTGATLAARQLNVGSNYGAGAALGHGQVTLSLNSVLTLTNVDGHRLAVGDWGSGTLIVNGGSLLDASANAAACAGHWCGSIIGHQAGSTAALLIYDPGSEVRLIGEMRIGATQRFDMANNGFDGGTPDGTTHATVQVQYGGKLVTEWVNVGPWAPGPASHKEQSFADLVVNGAASTWLIQGSALGGNDASLNLATGVRSTATLTVSQGGQLKLQAPAGRNAGVDLTSGGGQSTTTITGTGSRLDINGVTSRLVVGNANGGSAKLTVSDGAVLAQAGSDWSYLNIGEGAAAGRVEILSGGQVSGARAVNVGSGGEGSLLISGAGSLLTTDRNGSFVGQINVGQQGSGRLDVLGGGMASAFSLKVGGSDPFNNRGQVVIDGAGTTLALDAVDWHRMSINSGSVTVSGGALLDGTLNPAACTGHWCGVFIANNAGDNGAFTVTGAGTKARFLSNFNVGEGYATAPPSTAWTLGEPGGTSLAQVNVLAGGRLETESVNIAFGPAGPAATGGESVIAQLRIKGAGSVWSVSGSTGRAATFVSGVVNAANNLTDIQIADGGQLQLTGDPNWSSWVQLGANGGVNRMSITGAGSKLVYGSTNNAGLWIGRNGATASLNVSNGGAIEGVNRIQVGNTGAVANFAVSGTTSSVTYGSSFADLFIGRGAVGVADISGGALVQMHANNEGSLTVGDNGGASVSAGNGSLTLRGAGTLLSLKSGVAGDDNTDNPTVKVGWSSNGVVTIRDGAALRVEGLAPARASLYLQGAAFVAGLGTGAPSSGRVDVSGTGSRLDVLGVNPFITIGSGPYGSGQLSISNGAIVQTTLMGIADFGASGITQVDNATLKLDGAWRSGGTIGASLAVGTSTGSSGVLSLNHGAQLIIHNSGSERTQLALGGLDFAPGGTGMLSVAGGSSVSVGGGGGGQIVIGNTVGGIGTASVQGGSQMSASYVGVGALNGADQGVGTLLVQDSSTVTADQIEIGAKGFVGGTGTLIGNIINRGVFSPGNSPGTLHLQGSFANQAGGRLVLEVESDGHGGFVTDQLVFDAGSALSLAALQIQFRFLGATDPNAFQASGAFQIDSFLRQGNGGIDHGLLDGASYSASSGAYQFTSFSFSANGGAVFQAQAVPEPGTWVLMLAGLGLGGWLQRRRT